MEKIYGYRVLFDNDESGIGIFFEELYKEDKYIWNNQRVKDFQDERKARKFYDEMVQKLMYHREMVEKMEKELANHFDGRGVV